MNKKGMNNDLLILILVMSFLGIIMLAYFAYSLFAPILTTVYHDTTSTLLETPNDNNITTYLNMTFGTTDRLLQQTEWWSYGIIFIFFIAFITMCFYVRTYPFLIVVWILLGLVMIFISLYLADSYNSIALGGDYVALAYQSWEGNHYLLQYLPWVIGAFTFAGGIVMFALSKERVEDLVL